MVDVATVRRLLEIIERRLARLERVARTSLEALAHGYADIIPEKVHRSLSELDDIRSFVASAVAYLQRTGALAES